MEDGKIDDSTLIQKILLGTIKPEELEGNEHIFSLVTRIYGEEALEEMGVKLPSIGDVGDEKDTSIETIFTDSITLPPESINRNLEASIPQTEKSPRFFSKRAIPFIIVGLSIRLIFAPFLMDTHDMASYFLGVKDMVEGHSPYASANYSYPPLAMVIYFPLFYVLSLFYDPSEWFVYSDQVLESTMVSPLLSPIITSPVFNLVWKIPLIAADLVSAYLIFLIAREMGADSSLSRKISIAYFLNPLTIYVSSIMGQTDGLMATFLLASIYHVMRSEVYPAGIYLALSTSVKGYVLPIVVTIAAYLMIKKYYETGISFGNGKRVRREEVVEIMQDPFKFITTTAVVGILFLIPMLIWGGDLFVSRRIQSVLRFGGIHPFVFGSLITSDILRGSDGYKEAGSSLLDTVVSIQNLLRIEYSVTILIIIYYYKFMNKGSKEGLLLKGCILHLYFILMFGIGVVNTQYFAVLFPLIFCVFSLKGNGKISINSELLSGFLLAFYSASIVSYLFLFLPLATHTGYIDLGELLVVIENDWLGYGFATGKNHSTRWVILGMLAWISMTFSVIKALAQRKTEEII